MSRCRVLTPAASQDFATYVRALVDRGHHERAGTLASTAARNQAPPDRLGGMPARCSQSCQL